MQKLGAPARSAPKRKAKAGFPGNPAAFLPAVSDRLLLLDRGELDPEECKPWPRGTNTEQAMRMHSAFAADDHKVPEFAKLPVRRVRETLVVLSRRWDDFLRQRSRSEPMGRMVLQDDAQTQALVLDLVPPIRTMTVGNSPVPVFAVRWGHFRVTNGARAPSAMMESMERGTRMGNIPVEVDEIELLAALLEENAKRIKPSFVRKEGKRHMSVSVQTSISNEMQIAHYKSIGRYCHQCGTSGCDTMKCPCLSVQYCSRVCQKKNWKYHKKSCCREQA